MAVDATSTQRPIVPITIGAAGAAATATGIALVARMPNRTLGALLAVGGVAAMGAALVLHGRSGAAEPVSPPKPDPEPVGPSDDDGAPAPAPVRIAQMNAQNLFDTENGYGSDEILTPQQYDIKLGKLGLAIRDSMGAPDIIAMQEVENLRALQDLAARPEIAAYGYQPILVDGTDPRGIDVGYLYRPDRVDLVSAEARGTTRTSASGRNVQLFTRPPLVATFRAHAQGTSGAADARAGATFTLINNHFTSKLQGADGEEKRRLQSQWVEHLASGAAGVADLDPSRTIVMGDLNATPGEDAYEILTAAAGEGQPPRRTNAADRLPEAERYSWRDGNRRELLDHVLLPPALASAVQGVEILRINADSPARLASDPTTPRRSSDHDPVVVTIDTAQ
jgi:predicted extracellular nuclease